MLQILSLWFLYSLQIATVAFASTFTVPGETNSTGTATVVRSGSSKFFFFHIQSCCPLLFISSCGDSDDNSQGRNKSRERRVVEVINKLMWLASVRTTVSFIACSHIVLGRHNQGAAVLVLLIGGVTMTGVLGTMTLYVVRSKRTRSIRKRAKSSKSGTSSWYHNSELSDPDLDRVYAI